MGLAVWGMESFLTHIVTDHLAILQVYFALGSVTHVEVRPEEDNRTLKCFGCIKHNRHVNHYCFEQVGSIYVGVCVDSCAVLYCYLSELGSWIACSPVIEAQLKGLEVQ